MDESRRRLILGGVALATGPWLSAAVATARAAAPQLDPIPPLPEKPTPGRPGDFDFLSGEWRIHNRQPKPGSDEWIAFDGEATVHGILGGVASVEELRIPAGDFSGMGLRLLDRESTVWRDHWVNAKSGVIGTPGVPGSFEGGAGLFVSDDEEDGKPVKWVGVWDLVGPRSCRWRQAVSRDGARTWQQTWIMDWKRA